MSPFGFPNESLHVSLTKPCMILRLTQSVFPPNFAMELCI